MKAIPMESCSTIGMETMVISIFTALRKAIRSMRSDPAIRSATACMMMVIEKTETGR